MRVHSDMAMVASLVSSRLRVRQQEHSQGHERFVSQTALIHTIGWNWQGAAAVPERVRAGLGGRAVIGGRPLQMPLEAEA